MCLRNGYFLVLMEMIFCIQVEVPMYFESTKFNAISSIEMQSNQEIPGCRVKEPETPEKTKATTFPQNIKCTVPGVFCAIIRY